MGARLDIEGFFSYAHNDNIHSCLSKLKSDLCDEYRFVTGSTLNLYIDEQRLSWGDRWKENIRSEIDGSYFFIPVLSPNYFSSGNCIKELKQYLEKARRIEARELLLPLYLSDVRDDSLGLELDDELIDEVLGYQYCDIRSIRFCERGSAEYNKTLNKAVLDLARANQKLFLRSRDEVEGQQSNWEGKQLESEEKASRDLGKAQENRSATAEADTGSKDDQRYLLDDNVEFNEVVDKLSGDLTDISACITAIGNITNTHSEHMGRAKSLRPNEALALVAAYASELQPEADSYSRLANQYLAHTNEADVLIPSVATALRMAKGTSSKTLSDFEELIESAKTARTQMLGFRGSLDGAKRLSRVLYKPLSLVEIATSICLEAIETTIDWEIYFS